MRVFRRWRVVRSIERQVPERSSRCALQVQSCHYRFWYRPRRLSRKAAAITTETTGTTGNRWPRTGRVISRRSSSTCNPLRHILAIGSSRVMGSRTTADRTTGDRATGVGASEPVLADDPVDAARNAERLSVLAIGHELGSQSGPFQTGQTGQRPSAPVSSATQGQIRSSLEASGFKNVTVLPQSYLIRATAPDGSQVVMQVSSDGVYGVVVNSTDQASSSGTGGTSTGGTSSSAPGAPAPAPAVQAEPGVQAGTGSTARHRERQHRRSQRHWRDQQRHRKCRHRRHKRHWGHKQRHQQSQHRRQRRNRQHRDWGQQQHRRGEQHRHRRHQRQEQRQGADDNPLRAGCFRLAQARHREIAESDGLRLSGFPGWPDNWHRHGAGHAPFGAIALSAISTNWRATPGTLVRTAAFWQRGCGS